MNSSVPRLVRKGAAPAQPGSLAHDVGLFVLRVVPGLSLALLHGWGKVTALLSGAEGFPDPLGIGGVPSALLAASAEFLAALLVALGLFTRLATVPIILTMLVAVFVFHAGDPWKDRELASLYLVIHVAIAALGPGAWSLDAMWFRRGGDELEP